MAIAAEALAPEAEGAAAGAAAKPHRINGRPASTAEVQRFLAGGSSPAPSKPAPARSSSSSRNSSSRTVSKTVSSATKTITGGRSGSSLFSRLVLAFFLGVTVLEVLSQVTGRYFSFDLSKPLAPKPPTTYEPLYKNQVLGSSNVHHDATAIAAGTNAGSPSTGLVA